MRKRVDPSGVHHESDGFWSKVLVSTIVVVWVGLVAGQWGARWAIEHGKFAAKGSSGHAEVAMDQRPDYQPTAAPSIDIPTASASSSDLPMASDSPLQPESPRATVTVLPPAESPSDTPSDAVSPDASSSATSVDASTTPDSSASPDATATDTPVMPPSATASSSAAAGARPYTLQVGVYSNRANAEKVADDLRSKGYTVEVAPEASGTASTWAVHVGHFVTRDAASDQQSKLEGQGFSVLPVQR